MSRDIAAEMREFAQDEPTHRGMVLFWAAEVEAIQTNAHQAADEVGKLRDALSDEMHQNDERRIEIKAMQRRIAELEAENHRMKVVLNTVHGQDQEISRLRGEKISLEAQAERDRARIAELEDDVRASRYMHEETRLVAVKHWGQIESDREVIEAAREVEAAAAIQRGGPQRRVRAFKALREAIRLHDEKVNGHE